MDIWVPGGHAFNTVALKAGVISDMDLRQIWGVRSTTNLGDVARIIPQSRTFSGTFVIYRKQKSDKTNTWATKLPTWANLLEQP